MLNNISKKINAELQKEQDQKDFLMLINEDTEHENFIDNRILNISENGVNNEMLKNEMPFLFIEDTVVDDDLITNLQNEVDYEDNFEKKPITDNDETTDLQEPKDYDDDFSAQYASDAEADTKLTKEVDYADNQKTPVNIDEFSNEAADFLFEMGDILGVMDLLEDCDGTVPNEVKCPDEGDVIPQADEANVCDTEDPDMPEGVVMEDWFMEADEEAPAEGEDDAEDAESLEEEFNALFESADDDEDEDDDSDEDDEDESDDEDEECEDCKKGECEKHGKKSESVGILDLFA